MWKKEGDVWEVVRIKPSDSNNNICENKILRISGISLPSEVDGDVFLTSTAYKDIFGKTRKSSSSGRLMEVLAEVASTRHSVSVSSSSSGLLLLPVNGITT